MTHSFEEALAKAQAGLELEHQDIVELLLADEAQSQALFRYSDQVRRENVGDVVHLRGIIEFSNYCRQHCQYCGLRADNRSLHRYRLTEEDILTTARQAAECGYKTLVLQGGEDVAFSPDDIARITSRVKELGVAVTLSFGEYERAVYELWRDAGADRYLIKQETSDPDLYRKLRPGKELKDRLQCQAWLKELGYQRGSGSMIGLPGQTVDIMAEDLLLMKKMDVDMSGMGPFIPHPDTPLGGYGRGSAEMTLKMLAVARIIMPLVLLPATTSLATIHPRGRELSLEVGANVIMPNVSPQEFRAYYTIYPDKLYSSEPLAIARQELEDLITGVGRTVGQDLGHSPKPAFQNIPS